MYFRDQYRLVRKDIAREYGLVTVESKKRRPEMIPVPFGRKLSGLSRNSAIVLRIQPHTLTLLISPTTSFQEFPCTRSWTIAFRRQLSVRRLEVDRILGEPGCATFPLFALQADRHWAGQLAQKRRDCGHICFELFDENGKSLSHIVKP